MPISLYFIRIKDQFVRTFEDKFVQVLNVVRVEQVSVHGGPGKAERGYQIPGCSHIMLIVRTQSKSAEESVEKMLEAGKILDAIYQFEKCVLAEN